MDIPCRAPDGAPAPPSEAHAHAHLLSHGHIYLRFSSQLLTGAHSLHTYPFVFILSLPIFFVNGSHVIMLYVASHQVVLRIYTIAL